MKITLISPYSNITAIGLRLLSALLRKRGHETQLICLPLKSRYSFGRPEFTQQCQKNVLEEVAAICGDSHLIGISLMTNHFARAIEITERIRRRKARPLVIWGGIHPTIRPQECLQHADMICVGEGEEALLELVQTLEKGNDYHDIQNIWFSRNGNFIQNPLRPLVKDLDSLPFPDYSLEGHFILHDGKVQRLTDELLCKHLRTASIAESMQLVCYQTMVSRGCPFHCSYCCNDTLVKLYGQQGCLRFRSPENVVNELHEMKERWPFISGIWLSDDSLLAMPMEYIKRFSHLYGEKIGLPFFCLTDPVSVNEAKMDLLVDAGLTLLKMGIQSGSRKTLKLYNRNISNSRVLQAARTINKYRDRVLKPIYDIILDNPFESREDLLATLGLLMQIPRPYRLDIYSLTFFPGTRLYEKAKKGDFIKHEYREVYEKSFYAISSNYLNLLFVLMNYNLPKRLLYVLINKELVYLLHRKSVGWLCQLLVSAFRGMRGGIRMIRTMIVGKD